MPQATTTKTNTNKSLTKSAAKASMASLALATAITTLITIVVLEFILSLAGIGEQEYLRIDKIAGFAPIAGKHVTWRQEGYSRSQINSFGMRDHAYTLDKPKDTLRIAVVGDSLVEALQVQPEETFCRQMERQLNASGQTKYQVMNFGVASYNLGQMYLRLKDRILPFRPDLVILCVRNDTVMQLAANPQGGFLYARPSFFVGNNKQLIEDHTVESLWWHTPEARRMVATSWLREHSHIWGVVSVAAENIIFWYKTNHDNFQQFLAGMHHTAGTTPVPANNQIVQSLNAQGSQDAIAKSTQYLWPIADGLIECMQQACTTKQSKFMIVRLPARGNYENKTETTLLAKTAQALNVPLLDLGPSFHHQVDTSTQPLFFDFHLTAYGHEFLAKQLLNFIVQNHIVSLNGPSSGDKQ